MDEPELCDALWPSAQRAALLHRLWPVGPARHGLLRLRAEDPARPADRGVRRRPDGARLHLYRRHRRRGDRKSVGEGKSVSGRVDLGGRRILKKKTKQNTQTYGTA